jgi:hypothetical protein
MLSARPPPSATGFARAVALESEGLCPSIPGRMKGTFSRTYGVKVPFMRRRVATGHMR